MLLALGAADWKVSLSVPVDLQIGASWLYLQIGASWLFLSLDFFFFQPSQGRGHSTYH